jgi:hypothetical protein
LQSTCDDGYACRENFKNLLRVYRKAGAVKADPDLGRVIENAFCRAGFEGIEIAAAPLRLFIIPKIEM